jgi:anti-sigma B factor antagonist
MMRIEAVRNGASVRLGFADGDALDAVNAPALKKDALALLEGASDVTVDLSRVEFVDSAGVGLLVALFKAMRLKGGRVRYSRLRPGVRSVLEIIRLDRIFEIVEEAAEPAR